MTTRERMLMFLISEKNLITSKSVKAIHERTQMFLIFEANTIISKRSVTLRITPSGKSSTTRALTRGLLFVEIF
jgi:hypothetical protein